MVSIAAKHFEIKTTKCTKSTKKREKAAISCVSFIPSCPSCSSWFHMLLTMSSGSSRNFWSWLDDEYWDDVWAEAKLTLWFFAPLGLIALEIWLLGW